MTKPSQARGSVGVQTEIVGDKVGDGSSVKSCDWCDEKAVKVIELQRKLKGVPGGMTGSGVFMGACGKHIDILERTTEKPLPSS